MGKTSDLETKLAAEELAYQISQGLSLEKASSVCNLDLAFATQVASTKDFDQKLKRLNPEYYEIWCESQKEQASIASVRVQAINDGDFYYKEMKKLIQTKDALPPKEKAAILEKLLRLGGFFRDEEVREVVTMAPGHLKALKEASRETGMNPEDWPLPQND